MQPLIWAATESMIPCSVGELVQLAAAVESARVEIIESNSLPKSNVLPSMNVGIPRKIK